MANILDWINCNSCKYRSEPTAFSALVCIKRFYLIFNDNFNEHMSTKTLFSFFLEMKLFTIDQYYSNLL